MDSFSIMVFLSELNRVGSSSAEPRHDIGVATTVSRDHAVDTTPIDTKNINGNAGVASCVIV